MIAAADPPNVVMSCVPTRKTPPWIVQSSAVAVGGDMGFRPCVDQQDPFTRKVRDIYRANVVRAPRVGIDPLDVLAVRKTVVQPRGLLSAVIEGDAPGLPRPTTRAVADLRGERSTAVDVGLGAELATKFFAALGVPIPSAEVTASLWKGAHQISFEVRDVQQHDVDLSVLGRVLANRRLARNPATDIFFSDAKTTLLIITRTLTSPSFAVRVTDRSGQTLKVSVEGVEDIFGSVHADVSWEAEGDSTISFRGKTPATFAFAAVPCALVVNGTFVFGMEMAEATLGVTEAPKPEMRPVLSGVGLLTFDSDQDG